MGDVTGRYRVSCSDCGVLEADTEDGLFSEQAAHRRAGFHEGIQADNDHICSVEVVEQDLSALEEWKQHNSSFSYKPPERPADAWSEEQLLELFDRVINRQVQWFCRECTGHGPIKSLEDARRHVRKNHMADLLEKHETPREEQESVADGGTSQADVDRRAEENHDIGEFSERDSR
jgi:hypothetical protein